MQGIDIVRQAVLRGHCQESARSFRSAHAGRSHGLVHVRSAAVFASLALAIFASSSMCSAVTPSQPPAAAVMSTEFLDAYSRPQHDRWHVFDTLTRCWLTKEFLKRKSLYSENEIELVKDAKSFSTLWTIKPLATDEASIQLIQQLPRNPESLSFFVRNDSASPVKISIALNEENIWLTGPNLRSLDWTIGEPQLLKAGEGRILRFPMSKASCATNPELKLPRIRTVPCIKVKDLQKGIQYKLNLKDFTVHYPQVPGLTALKIACPNKVEAGKPVKLTVKAKGRVSGKKIDLEMRDGEWVVWRIRLNQSEVKQLSKGSCVVNRTAPWYIGNRTYKVGLVSDGLRVSGDEASVHIKNNSKYKLPLAQRKQYNGRPSFFVNEKPFSWRGYSSYDFSPGNVADFGAAGAKVFYFPIGVGAHIDLSMDPIWMAPGKYDFSHIDELVSMSLAASPDALVFLRMSLSLPPFWVQEHPNDRVLVSTKEGLLPWVENVTKAISLASDAWQADQEKMIRQTIDYCKSRPWASRVAGFWLTGEVTEEWMAWGCNSGYFSDYSPTNQAAFAKWLEDHKYPVPGPSPIPTPEARTAQGYDVLPDTPEGRMSAFYHKYYAEMKAKMISRFAKVVKEQTGGRSLVCVYGGYPMTLAGYPRQATSCQIPMSHELVADPNIDVVGACPQYPRLLEGRSDYMTAVSSFQSAGKLYLCENDQFSWLHPLFWYQEYYPQDPRKGAILMHRRQIAVDAVNGVVGHWFGLSGSWHNDRALMEDISKDMKICAESLKYDRTSTVEVAFVIDDESFCWSTVNSLLPGAQTEKLRYAIGRTGTAVETWLMTDLDKLPERIRFVVISHTYAANPESIAKLNALIQKGGRTIVVVGMPGLVNPDTATWDELAPSRILGLPIRVTDAALPGEVALLDGTLISQDDYTQKPKVDYPVRPRAWLDGTGFMKYVDGPYAAAQRQLDNGGRLIWCAMPPTSTTLLRGWLLDAGVNIYAPQECSVYTSKELVAVNNPTGGHIVLKWPNSVQITDMFDGWTGSGTEIPCDFEQGQTRLFVVKPL